MHYYLRILSKHRSAIMGLAILWVMLFHIPYSFGFVPFDLIKGVGYGGVDIFLFLSGFGLYFSCSKDEFNLYKYYKSRFSRIMPEFWLVLLLAFIIKMDFSGRDFYNLACTATTLGYWVWGRVPFEHWYISCILLFYAIFPWYYMLFKKYGVKVPLFIIGGGFVLMALYALICVMFFNRSNIGGTAILTYARIPIFFIGSIFGYWAKEGKDLLLSRTRKIIYILLAVIAFVSLIGFMKYMPEGLWICSLYFIPFILMTPVLCVILSKLFDKFPKVDKILAYVGSISLELYLCHGYIFECFDFFSANWGVGIALLSIILLSLIAAFALYLVNKKWLQVLIKHL